MTRWTEPSADDREVYDPAEVFAAELGLPLFVVKIDRLISSYLGETAANIRIETPDHPVIPRGLQCLRQGLQMIRRCHRPALRLPPSVPLQPPPQRRRPGGARGECQRLGLLRGTTDRRRRYRRSAAAGMPP